MLRHEETPGAGTGGLWKASLAGDASEDSPNTEIRQPLVIEAHGAVRTATMAELRRLARLGLREALA